MTDTPRHIVSALDCAVFGTERYCHSTFGSLYYAAYTSCDVSLRSIAIECCKYLEQMMDSGVIN